MEFTACYSLGELMPKGALTSFTEGLFKAYRYFAGQILTSQSRSRIEYLLPTDNFIVLNLCFNWTKKSNLIDRF